MKLAQIEEAKFRAQQTGNKAEEIYGWGKGKIFGDE